jgi:hypothetical protein
MVDFDSFIKNSTVFMAQCGYTMDCSYEFCELYTVDEDEFYKLASPAYNLRVYYGFDTILEVALELDVNYSLDITPERLHYFQDILTEKAMCIILVNGIATLVSYSNDGSTPYYYSLKESWVY